MATLAACVAQLHEAVERTEVEHRDAVDRRPDVEVAEVRRTAPAELGDAHDDPDDAGHLGGRGPRIDPGQEPPPPGDDAGVRELAGADVALAAHVDRDHVDAVEQVPHDADRHVVEHAAVDEQVAVDGAHRREHAGDREARAEPEPRRPGPVDLDLAAGEVGRHAEAVRAMRPRSRDRAPRPACSETPARRPRAR